MFKAIASLTTVVALTLGAISCTTTSTVPADPHMSGQWKLDPAASEDADVKISDAIDNAEGRLRKRLSNAGFSQYDEPQTGGPGGGRHPRGGTEGAAGNSAGLNGEEFSQTGYIGPDFNSLRRNLNRVLASPKTLVIDVKSDDVRIAGDDLPPRDYPPDDAFTRIDEYGTARIDTSWSGMTFSLRARYDSHATVKESYTADAHNDTLTVVRLLSDPVAGKLAVRSVYRR
jgi:hypothetical protein